MRNLMLLTINTQRLLCTQVSQAQGPEEMCLSLEHQNPSKTSEKMGYFDRCGYMAGNRSRFSKH